MTDNCTKPDTRRAFSRQLRNEIYQRDHGRCRHCNNRVDTETGYHLDHHPIPHRDIINNACANHYCQRLCFYSTLGQLRIVTDPMDSRNIKLSCPQCNTSHRHEPANKCYYCGHSQPYCYQPNVYLATALCAMFIIGLLVGGSLVLMDM